MWILENWELLPLTMNVKSGVPRRSLSTSFPLSVLYQDASSMYFIFRGSGVCTGVNVTAGVGIITDVGVTADVGNTADVVVTTGVDITTGVGATADVDVTAEIKA
jgi:hypothetical protein